MTKGAALGANKGHHVAKKKQKLDPVRHAQESTKLYDRVEQEASPWTIAYLNANRDKDRAALAEWLKSKGKKPRS